MKVEWMPLTDAARRAAARLEAAVAEAAAEGLDVSVEVAMRVRFGALGEAAVMPGPEPVPVPVEGPVGVPVGAGGDAAPFDPAAHYGAVRDAAWPIWDDAEIARHDEGVRIEPLAAWLERSVEDVRARRDALCGGLTDDERAQLAAWLDAEVGA